MFSHIDTPLQGYMCLLADAALLLIILVSGTYSLYHPRWRLWCYALFGLCWSAIVVIAAAAQSIRVSFR